MDIFKAGFIAIMGAPNAGKSTFLNKILGEKIAIVSPKPQTTRHRILGVLTEEAAQLVFWDTPGLHESRSLLNQEMQARALAAMEDSDLVLWMVDAVKRGPEHKLAKELVMQSHRPLIVAINKVDLLPDKGQLLPLIDELQKSVTATAIVPISAQKDLGLSSLLSEVRKVLPESPHLFPVDTLTDQMERTIAGEMIREAVFQLTSQEIPYATAVTIDEFSEEETLISIAATIHVEKESQKGVIIGKGGQMLKNIGSQARQNIERLLDCKVFLKLFVRTTRDWSKNRRSLLEYGYGE